MKIFKILAKSSDVLEAFVEAETEDEALQLAKEMDEGDIDEGGEFNLIYEFRDWDIYEVREVENKGLRIKAPLEQCCDECGRDTRRGTGLFVNRLPADIGYICPDCSAIDCDRCEEKIALDEDIRPWQLGLEEENEFGDGAFFVHEECLTPEEATLLAEQQEKEDEQI